MLKFTLFYPQTVSPAPKVADLLREACILKQITILFPSIFHNSMIRIVSWET